MANLNLPLKDLSPASLDVKATSNSQFSSVNATASPFFCSDLASSTPSGGLTVSLVG